ncbi:Thymidylate kinase [Heterocephalus glaber]|uniref:dTMP kinase n=1 Tax=Heterocephalus glaber TaxID=10181 RepID=G5C3S3_HETGA|nr:Thymidylate kinase [Heterocephalus glaber]
MICPKALLPPQVGTECWGRTVSCTRKGTARTGHGPDMGSSCPRSDFLSSDHRRWLEPQLGWHLVERAVWCCGKGTLHQRAPVARPLIKEKLRQGVTLVVDRYAFSGVAFTSAKENFSLDWCKQPDVGLPKPDLILFLQLQLADASTRGEFGRERYEEKTFQERVLGSFQQLMRDSTLNWKVVDASKSIEAVHEEICSLSEAAILGAARRPLGELWL